MFFSSFLDDVPDLLDPPDLLEDEPKAKVVAINRDVAYILKPAFGSLSAIPHPKKPSVINGSAPATSKPQKGERILKFLLSLYSFEFTLMQLP